MTDLLKAHADHQTAFEMLTPKAPAGFEKWLSPVFETLLHDKGSNTAIGWGFKLTAKIEDDTVAARLKEHGDIEFLHTQTADGANEYGLVVLWLSPEVAERKYGKPSGLEFGPRGGFRQILYGKTVFNHRRMNPRAYEPYRTGALSWQALAQEVDEELVRARTKFPGTDLVLTAFGEEYGEAVRAVLEHYYLRKKDATSADDLAAARTAVRKELVQTIAMAVRCELEGDPVHGLPGARK